MSQTNYIDLIQKKLSEEITQDELTQLNNWINASSDNRKTAESIATIWENTAFDDADAISLAGDVDVEVEFAFLEERINAEETKNVEETTTKVIPMRTPRRKFLGIAASIAVVVGLGLTWVLLDNKIAVDLAELKTGDTPQEILLADGSIISLNAQSTLSYPITFEGDTREVKLEGEAFFDIAKDQGHPFIVHTPYEDVTVLGTSFNVRAYENEPNSEVVVETGKVQVESGPITKILLPNEKVIVDHSSGTMGFEQTETLNESAWHTKKFDFPGTKLEQVLDDLADAYNISFTYEQELIDQSIDYSGSFDNDSLENIMLSISTVTGVTITKTADGKYTITEGEQ